MGYQTSSCIGARQLPYEVSRDYIPVAIEQYKTWQKFQEDRAADLMKNPPSTITRFAMYGFQENETFERPADFDAEVNYTKGSFGYGEGYQMEHRSQVKQARQNAEHLMADIDFLQKRYDNWKPQHDSRV